MTCFSSADESAHYGFSVCLLLEHYRAQLHWAEEGVVELGTGDATAIADVVASLPGLRVASYSDPVTTVRTAGDLGYRVANFLAMVLDFGRYSSEPKVRAHIQRLCDEGKAWAADDGYMVAVALFTRNPDIPGDRADQLLRSLQFCP